MKGQVPARAAQPLSASQPHLTMPPCAEIARALDPSGFGQSLEARSQQFRIDGPCQRVAANDKVADNPGGLSPIQFEAGKDQLVEFGLGYGCREYDVLRSQLRIDDGLFV